MNHKQREIELGKAVDTLLPKINGLLENPVLNPTQAETVKALSEALKALTSASSDINNMRH